MLPVFILELFLFVPTTLNHSIIVIWKDFIFEKYDKFIGSRAVSG